ncbi:MAG: M1 family metallopeptidase [Candidatus Coproplasma sp.]
MKKLLPVICATAVFITTLPLSACSKKESAKLSSYSICASYDEGKRTLSGVCDFTYYNSTDNEISSLSFNLWGNAYRQNAKYKPISDKDDKAYYSGRSYGNESVEKVEGCAEWAIGGEDENILKVTLSEPVYPEQSTSVSISYTLTLANVNHRTGVTQSTVNLGNFYPVLCAYTLEGFAEYPYYSTGDPFISECADYDVKLTFPREYIVATSGRELTKEAEGENITTHCELKNARDFAVVISKDFKTLTAQYEGVNVNLYYLGDRVPKREFTAVCDSLKYFSSTFGKYCYPTLSVVFTPLNVSGMEYPALTMISSALSEKDAIYTAVHENAHQWWYAMVGSDQVNCAWQDEGLAEYSALCFFENNPSYGYTRTGLLGTAVKAYRGYYSVYNQIFGDSDTTMNRSLCDFDGDYEYVNIAYNKALIAFENVRCAMGDKKFFSALSSYFKHNCGKIASPEELISHFTSLYDVEGIFSSFIEGKAVI